MTGARSRKPPPTSTASEGVCTLFAARSQLESHHGCVLARPVIVAPIPDANETGHLVETRGGRVSLTNLEVHRVGTAAPCVGDHRLEQPPTDAASPEVGMDR